MRGWELGDSPQLPPLKPLASTFPRRDSLPSGRDDGHGKKWMHCLCCSVWSVQTGFSWWSVKQWSAEIVLQTRTGRRRGKKKKKRREGAEENDRQIDWLCGRAVSVALVVMHPNSAQSSGSRFWIALLCRGPLCSTGPAGDNRITSCCGGLVGHGAISLGLCSTTHIGSGYISFLPCVLFLLIFSLCIIHLDIPATCSFPHFPLQLDLTCSVSWQS